MDTGAIDVDSTLWFRKRVTSGLPFWLMSFLFAIAIALPLLIAVNILITPCYMFAIVTNIFNINRNRLQKFWIIILLIFVFAILYVFAPVIFLIVTVP